MECPDPSATGSTLTETISSDKAGSGKPRLGFNAGNEPLDRVRVDSSDRALTTNQGVPVADNQNSLKAGFAAPRCSKISFFAKRSRISITSAYRSGSSMRAARPRTAISSVIEPLRAIYAGLHVCRGRKAHARVRTLLDCRRRARFGRYCARCARLRGEVLYR